MRPCRRCFVPQAQQRVTAAPSYTPVIHAGPGTGRLLARSLTATAAIAETRLVSYSKLSRRHLERNRDCNTYSETEGEIGLGRGAGISPGPFPQAVSRTRRAHY